MILNWSATLLKETANILLDRDADAPLAEEIRAALESDGDTRISDLHLWKVAQNQYACIVALVASQRHAVEEYRRRLQNVHELAHVTIEINYAQSPA